MAILVTEDNKNGKVINESRFQLEDNLQEYVKDNPDIIPLYEIEEDTRLFVAAREFTTDSGPIDALGFDNKGNIYVVETKLFRNPDKRTVVAQALDYGASLWRHKVDFDDFLSQVSAYTNKESGASFKEAYEKFFDTRETNEIFDMIRENLSSGNIKFVILMDSLHDRLKDLIVYINQNSKFDIYAIEVEYYKHDKFEIVIPKLFGAEVKKDVVAKSSRSAGRRWDEESFFEEADENGAELSKAIKSLYDWVVKNEAIVLWRGGEKRGAVNIRIPSLNDKTFLLLFTDGDLRIRYGWFEKEEQEHLFAIFESLGMKIGSDGIVNHKPNNSQNLPEYCIQVSGDRLSKSSSDIIKALNDFTQYLTRRR
ncbi:MAG: hypothetical protein LBT19_02850 [Candidatus Nomurabacteria bacterium]|jgi:hypothetical protein|nr:hypothetical protein [Candidatus Nomurabacteria bacterium]